MPCPWKFEAAFDAEEGTLGSGTLTGLPRGIPAYWDPTKEGENEAG